MINETKLLIDKISITARDPDINHVKTICERLQDLAESDTFNRYQIKPSRWRYIECSIPVPLSDPHSKNHVRFEVGARHRSQPDYRFEFNPSKIAPTGISDFLDFMKSNTGVDLDDFLRNGIVTRIDLALNLYDVSLETVIVRSRGAQKMGVYTDRHSNPEWVALGSPRSNRTIAYSKTDDDGRKFVRLERRMKPRLPVNNLISLPDPFIKAQLIGTEFFLPHLDGIVAEHFFDSMRLRGISAAVSRLPPGSRKAIKKMMQDPAVSLIPSTGSIWKQWPQLLTETGLGPFQKLAVDDDPALAPALDELANDRTTTISS